ncbi:MAG: ABC transporter ATP-binding protein/permease [Lactobacillus sp.]|jgi:ATP-binding cassette subfamily B protein|nr:ABC transporter ATP-binding protein/permease [Lactobacillus sp.]
MKISVFKFLVPYFYKVRYPLILSISFTCFGEIFSRIAAFYGSRLIGLISSDPVDRYSVVSQALFLIFIFAFLMALRGALVNLSIRIDAGFIPSVQARIYKDLFEISHKKAPTFFEQEMSGNVSNKIENIVSIVERFYYAVVWVILNPAMVLLISLGSIAMISVDLALILFGIFIVYLYLMYKSSRLIMPYTKKSTELNSRANGELIDSLINADIVKGFGRRFHEHRHYSKKLIELSFAQRKEINISAWIYILQSTLRTAIQIVFCIIPLYFWYKDKLSFEDFVFVQSIIMSLIYVFSSMIDMFLRLFARYSILHDGLTLVLRPCYLPEHKGAKALKVTKAQIDFNDVSFAYPDVDAIFQDFSLSINSHQKVGFVGYSGSGKSTLIKLLNRYYDVSSGAITIDGQDISKVKQATLHQNIAMIPQEPSLFNRTIMENIRYGKKNATDKEVIAAAKKAFCHDFIISLPNGYSSKVGERGVMLSGGERQRIAIARAILKDAPILILDEATSALDSESELYIQSSLVELMKGKTVIAIAHRLSTLREMDKVVVLDKGKIVEEGPHSQLIRHKGIYQKLYKMQTNSLQK